MVKSLIRVVAILSLLYICTRIPADCGAAAAIIAAAESIDDDVVEVGGLMMTM